MASKSLVPTGGTAITTSQTGIETGGGDNAARDIYKTQSVNLYPSPAAPISKLVLLIRKLKAEGEEEKILEGHIRQLQVFTRVVENEEVIGLDGKLAVSKRTDQLEMARYLKEMIFAELQKNCFSPAFQNLYAHLLAEIWELFNSYVVPAIQSGAGRQEIDELVNTKVIQPVAKQIAECGEENDLSISDLRGMLYYLTGNCHVKWL